MTNREAYEEGAGMGLAPEFFTMNGINPDAAYIPPTDCDCGVCDFCSGKGRNADDGHIDIITAFQNAGHTYHCACRLVWGDGQCECQGKGIVPGNVSRMIL